MRIVAVGGAAAVRRRCLLLSALALVVGSIAPLPPAYATPVCTGDCNGDGSVTVDEIVIMVAIALGGRGVGDCAPGDPDGSGSVTVDEILTAIRAALRSCDSVTTPPTSTFTPTPTPTGSLTPTRSLTSTPTELPATPAPLGSRDRVRAATRAAITDVGVIEVYDFGFAAARQNATGGLRRLSRLQHGWRAVAGGGAGVIPCSGGGSRTASFDRQEDRCILTEEFFDCTESDPETGTRATFDGRRTRSVASPTFCDTGEIPAGIAQTLDLAGFRVEFQCEKDCPPTLRDAVVAAESLRIERQPISDEAPGLLRTQLSGNFDVTNRLTGERFRQQANVDGFRIEEVAMPNSAVGYAVKGPVLVDCLGEVDFDTRPALVFDDNTKCPFDGVLEVGLPMERPVAATAATLSVAPSHHRDGIRFGAGAGTTSIRGLRDAAFRAANGAVYQVLQFQRDAEFGAEDFRVTTIAGSASDLALCAIASTGESNQIFGTAATDLFDPTAVLKSVLIADSSPPCFNPSGAFGDGLLCIGPDCAPGLCVCPSGGECAIFSAALPGLVDLTVATADVAAAETVDAGATFSSACDSLVQNRSAYRFGGDGPTTETQLCAQEPADGILLPGTTSAFTRGAEGSTLILLYEAGFGTRFLTGTAGVPIDRDGSNRFGCGADTVLLPGAATFDLSLPPQVTFSLDGVAFDYNADARTDDSAPSCNAPALLRCAEEPRATPTPNPVCGAVRVGEIRTYGLNATANRSGGASCGGGGNGAPDASVLFTAPFDGFYRFETLNADFDTVLYARTRSCVGSELACNDDREPATTDSEIGLSLSQDDEVVIVVDGFGAGGGNVQLRIQFAGATPTPTSTPTPRPTLPNLRVDSFLAPASAVAGMQAVVSANIRNDGTAASPPFAVDFFYSVDEVFGDNDVDSLFGCIFSGLGAGSSVLCQGPIGVPAGLPGGTYHLLAVVDRLAEVAESDESDNVRSADSGLIVIAAGPPTATPTRTPTVPAGSTATATRTRTATVTGTETATATATMAGTGVATLSPTRTPSRTRTPTPTRSLTRTPTPTLDPSAIIVVAKPVGVAIRSVPSAGLVVIGAGLESDVVVTLALETSDVERVVTVTTSAPGVATVAGPVMIPPGARAASLRVQAGEAGTATLRLRLGETVRDLEVIVGPLPSGALPAVFATIVGTAVRAAPSAGQLVMDVAGENDVTLTLLATAAMANVEVHVESSDPTIADVVGTSMIATGERTTMLRIRAGVAGKAQLRLRAGDEVRVLEVIVGEPGPRDVPAVTAPIVGVSVP